MVAIISHIRYWGGKMTCSLPLIIMAMLVPLQVSASMTELKSDSTYMSLISREEILSNREDSLSNLLVTYRNNFAAGGDQAVKAKESIIGIEMELFDLRKELNTMSDNISKIEAEWSANNPNTEGNSTTSNATSGGSTTGNDTSKTISNSQLATKSLPKGDLEDLRIAEAVESKCAEAYIKYIELYEQMRELLQLYAQTDDEDEAIEYSSQFHTLRSEANSLSDILQEDWGAAYDNKYFAYNMLMEILGYEDLLTQSSDMAYECESQIISMESGAESSAVVRYDAEKRNMVKLEELFAKKLQLSNAIDSLNIASANLAKVAILEELPALQFIKRSFILYEPILFSTAPVYDASNPIPETVIYNKGTIYRIHYGAFNSKQSPTIFHGAYPLSYHRDGGLWVYYGGGFQTYAEAEEAAALCKSKGFKRPEVVIWRDGESRNLARDPFPTDQKYRVQIIGLTELSSEIRDIIETHCPEAELSKIGADRYVIGPLVGQLIVEEFTTALELASPALTTNIIEMTE